jgi:amino acid adenylation domain-containing protein
MSVGVDLLGKLAETVNRRRDRTAVEASDGTFTYGELDRLSNQLANRLRALGVERDSRVGISLPRGAGELIAILATAKGGGAYVPLDPSHPADRLRIIMEDAAPQVLIAHPGSSLSQDVTCPVLVIDSIAAVTAGHPDSLPQFPYDPEQLAYVLFTSGSTGRPKGVEITRGAFANFLSSMAHTPGLSEDDRLLAITTTSFDIAGLELFLPLWVGATVVIADKETARDPRLLRPRLENDRITMLQATPATWRLLLEAGWTGDGKLRMLCGGEALSPTLADRLLAAGGELWNVYGPTETTVWSTLDRILPGYERITIGRPIDETEVYVLDEKLSPVPVGQDGELWIGGKGLARGYRGRPDLTAERFVQNPHGPPGDRIYRTGDLGRQQPDGRFECLGRLDHQVKIRGFRIELGEIETVLRSVPGVLEALVVAEQRQDGDPRLIAYWVGAADRESLIEKAQSRLPAYMVPAAYVPLQIFPINTNGKIDRKRLPAPDAALDTGSARQRPRNDTETRIAAIWCDILGLPHVPVDQSFFTLGGTSVLAIQLVARLEQELDIDLTLQAFFEEPTVSGMAARVGKSFSLDDPIVVWLRRGPSEQAPLFCLFGVNLYQDLALSLEGNRRVIGAHVPFRYVPGRDRRPNLTEIAHRYLELIRRHQERGPYHLLGLCFGGIVAYEVGRLLEAAGETVEAIVIIDAVLPTAIHVDPSKRLRSYVQQAIQNPQKFKRWLRKNGENLTARIPLLGRFRPPVHSAHNGAELIDLPVDGPEVEAEVHRFAGSSSRLATQLLVVRATQEPMPDWMSVDADQGWAGRASQVTIHDVPANHLGVLREPHVRSLARAVSMVSKPSEGGAPSQAGRRSSVRSTSSGSM